MAFLTPYSRGSVTLSSSNPYDPPLIDTNFLSHPFDLAAITEGIRTANAFYSSPSFKRDNHIMEFIGPDPDKLSKEEFEREIKKTMGSFLHAVGTTAMGPWGVDDDNDGDGAKGVAGRVVDPEFRVRGVKGLRVVDAGVIPYVPSGHTQAPVYIVAERAVDFIRETWGQKYIAPGRIRNVIIYPFNYESWSPEFELREPVQK
ncbi:aryl-alcohol oxidase [Coprinopsis cinerea AmutBmut pab1-1]|nr:aryl-alcohol oxidase [Coprinopsis cinerea AmutBmut pab1-1]